MFFGRQRSRSDAVAALIWAFLQNKGKLIVERGDLGDDAMRVIMCSINLFVIEHAKRRPAPYPPIRIRIDEATNAGLVGGPGSPEQRGVAETAKNGLYWEFLVQNLDFPGGSDALFQNCLRHEWFGCAMTNWLAKGRQYRCRAGEFWRKPRGQRIAAIADELMNFPPGWRWVRDPSGSRKEYVPLLENPWVDWPGLRAAKLREKLQCIYSAPNIA